jgi:hypothetical protein
LKDKEELSIQLNNEEINQQMPKITALDAASTVLLKTGRLNEQQMMF